MLVAMLFLLAHNRNVNLFLEQPLTSLMPRFSPMKEVIEFCLEHKQMVWLSAFGAPSDKPLSIFCSSPAVASLKRSKPHNASSKLYVRNARGKCTGCSKALKESQAYPQAFGEAVAQIVFELSRQR